MFPTRSLRAGKGAGVGHTTVDANGGEFEFPFWDATQGRDGLSAVAHHEIAPISCLGPGGCWGESCLQPRKFSKNYFGFREGSLGVFGNRLAMFERVITIFDSQPLLCGHCLP